MQAAVETTKTGMPVSGLIEKSPSAVFGPYGAAIPKAFFGTARHSASGPLRSKPAIEAQNALGPVTATFGGS